MDSKYLFRDEPAVPLEIVGSKGSYLYTKERRYIDFIMGWNVGNVGWDNKEMTRELKRFNGPHYVEPYYLYKPWADLAELLADITPGNLSKSFRATGGTEAVEIALQAAMVHTKRTEFVSIDGAYHGHSIAAMSVGPESFRRHWKLLPNCHKIPPPLNADAGRKVEKILKSEKVAAFIAEPIICNLGVVIPDNDFFGIVSDACRSYGTLLIIDEVATGFGRTGRMFGAEHYNLKPDIMTLGKGITSGYAGLGATITTKAVADSMHFNFSVYSTFGWTPMATAIAIANIRYIRKHRLAKRAEEMGRYFEARLQKMRFRQMPEITAKGLAIGMRFKDKAYMNRILLGSRRNGLLFSTIGSHRITFFPALTISKETAKEGLDIFSRSV
jgi:acetylornithine/succinyldiaminopimelate/putrescine aminotransferase